MTINLNNMSDIEIMAINKMHLEDKIKKLEEELSKLKQQQLYKEDFDLTCYAECNCNGEGCGYGLIDNSKYDKFPSKDVK